MIAITGIGVLSPAGDSVDAVLSALREKRSPAASIPDFDSGKYAKVRGMRMYNRATQLAICATKLALVDAKLLADDGKLEESSAAGEELGLLMASSQGHLDMLLEYDRSLVANGLLRTNAALMPLSIPSAPGAMVALSIGAKAFSMTFCDNGGSFLDALAFGARWLEEKRARTCVVACVFSPSADMRLAAERAGIPALGEGAVTFVLESVEDARKRGSRVRGTIRGFGSAYALKAGAEGALLRACSVALRSAGLAEDGISSRVPATAVTGTLGECFDASGGYQAMLALGTLEPGKHSLVTASSRGGACSALVLSGEDIEPGRRIQ